MIIMIIPHDSLHFLIIIVNFIPIIVIPHVRGTAFFIHLIFFRMSGGLTAFFMGGEGFVCKFRVKDRGPRTTGILSLLALLVQKYKY